MAKVGANRKPRVSLQHSPAAVRVLVNRAFSNPAAILFECDARGVGVAKLRRPQRPTSSAAPHPKPHHLHTPVPARHTVGTLELKRRRNAATATILVV